MQPEVGPRGVRRRACENHLFNVRQSRLAFALKELAYRCQVRSAPLEVATNFVGNTPLDESLHRIANIFLNELRASFDDVNLVTNIISPKERVAAFGFTYQVMQGGFRRLS